MKRKLQAEFAKNTPTEVCITAIVETFSGTVTVEYRERSEMPQKITDDKVKEVHDFCINKSRTSSRQLLQLHQLRRIEL